MDLTDLTNMIKEKLWPGSTAIQTAPGQTYGPAQALVTRTPITFRQGLPGGASGIYSNQFDSALGQAIPTNHPVIRVDPTTSDVANTYGGDVKPVIHHEIAHAVLESQNPGYEKLATSNPEYNTIATQMGTNRQGFQPAEIPAYMAEPGAAARWNVSPNLVDLYRQHLMNNLDPATAAMYQKNMGK